MSERSAFQRFLIELRRRHVPQTAAVYLVAAWAAIEFSDVVVPNLNGPDWVVPAVIVAAGVGFPVVLILAWIFDWGPEGIHRTDAEAGESGGARAGAGPVRGTPRGPTTPWMAAVAVLVVGIGSALAVAALLSGEDEGAAGAGAEAEGEAPRAPAPPPVMAPGGIDSSVESEVRRALEKIPDLSKFDALGGLGALGSLGEEGGLDSADIRQLMEVAMEAAAEAGIHVVIQTPVEWRLGRVRPVTLAGGDTLDIRGVARDTVGVVAVEVDGRTVAEAEEPEKVLPFGAELPGTGGAGEGVVEIAVRTADGRRIAREYPIRHGPGGAP